jgi:hypothetical protein
MNDEKILKVLEEIRDLIKENGALSRAMVQKSQKRASVMLSLWVAIIVVAMAIINFIR